MKYLSSCALTSLTIATFAGHGNSFHGEGSRGSKVAQLRYCLRLLLSICNCADDAILQDMHEQGAIPMLISKYT